MFRILLFVALFIPCVHISVAQTGSKEKIYSSYIHVNKELERTKTNLQDATNTMYYRLTLLYQKEGDSAQVSFDRGMRIKESKIEIIRYINELKGFLIAKCEDKTRSEVLANDTVIGLENLKNFDDYTTPEGLLMDDQGSYDNPRKFSLRDLTKQLDEYTAICDSALTKSEKKEGAGWNFISSDFNGRGYWNSREHPFREKPLAGIITYLSKIQIDILLTEKAAVEHLIWRESSKE